MQICPYCESELSDSARKCKFCGEWVKKESKTTKKKVATKKTTKKKEVINEEDYSYTNSGNSYGVDFEGLRNYANEVDKMYFDNPFLGRVFGKIKACGLFLWIIVLLWISMIIPALVLVVKRGDPGALFLMPIGLILSIWLFGRDKILNTVILFGTIAITISAWHVVTD